jgi:hypothetical protein
MELTEIQINEAIIIRKYLINLIRLNKEKYYTTYQELVDNCNLLEFAELNRYPTRRKELGVILAYLLIDDSLNNRPILTSLVYGKKLYRPRDGFYKTLCNNDVTGSEGKTPLQISKDIELRRKFEHSAVEFWRNEENFIKYRTPFEL